MTGPKTFRPDLYDDFVAMLPGPEQRDPLQAYVQRILNPDRDVHFAAAKAWYEYERALSQLTPDQTRLRAILSGDGRCTSYTRRRRSSAPISAADASNCHASRPWMAERGKAW